MDFVVYILYSKKFQIHYVGYTSNLISRFKSHNELSTKGFTYKYRPWVVIHLEFFDSKNLAIKREKWFKSGAGRDYIKSIKL